MALNPRDLPDLPPLPQDVQSEHAIALTLRHNTSLWYEQLDPSKVVPVLKDKLGFTEAQVQEVESYSGHRRAQAAIILYTLYDCDLKFTLASIPGHEKLVSQLTKDYESFMSEVQHTEPSSCQPISTLHLLSGSFYELQQEVIECLVEFPNALEKLKQALASLSLPVGDGKVVPIVDPSLYNDAHSVANIFSSLSPLINPLSLNLLQACLHATEYSPAVAKITGYRCLMMSNGAMILCSNKWAVPTTIDGLNSLNTSAMSGAEVAHTASLDQLQSVHPSFARSSAVVPPEKYVRVSACINGKSISLASYDSLLTAISGFFMLPKCAFTYVGCTEQPLCLSWMVSKDLQPYMKRYGGGVSGECMLSEQQIVNLMVGDWINYHCLTINESMYLFCAFYGLCDRLKCILSHQINLNSTNYGSGATALTLASYHGHEKLVQMLVDTAASKDIQNKNNSTALVLASGNGHDKIVQLLIDAGANKDIQNDTGATALICACAKGHVEIVQMLIHAGASLDITDNIGDTGLTVASISGNEKVVEVLIRAGANLDHKRKTGATALYCASEKGHVEISKLLIQAGATLDVSNPDGLNALHAACIRGHTEIMRLFIQAGCNHIIDAREKDGWTALYYTCNEGHAQISELLIQAGASLDPKTPLGYTPLIMASGQNHLVIVKQLVQAGASLNLYDKQRRTALFWACMKGHAQVVRELVQAGADATIASENSQTPFDVASISGHVHVCQVFTEMATVNQHSLQPITRLF